jgi:lipopolysaccharide transport system ATP-binding protein
VLDKGSCHSLYNFFKNNYSRAGETNNEEKKHQILQPHQTNQNTMEDERRTKNEEPTSNDVLVRVENVSKKFCRDLKKSLWYGIKDLSRELFGCSQDGRDELRPDDFWAVKDVSFELKRGECLGLIGRNGAGKTTLLRMLNGLIKPDKGRIEMHGRVGALIALGAGFNPILTGRENIYVNAAILGLNKKETDEKFDEIVEFAELSEFIDAPVQSYSSGMAMRLGFAVATALEPDILIIDEILAVGDVGFKMKAYKRIGKLLDKAAVVFVTHSMVQVYRICDHVAVMDAGHFKIHSSIDNAIEHYNKQNKFGYISISEKKIIHNTIFNFDYTYSSTIINNEKWILEIKALFTKNLFIELAIINFTSLEGCLVGEYRNNINYTLIPSNFIQKLNFSINSLPLKSGKYIFDFALYSKGRKKALIHVSGAGPVSINNKTLTEATCILNGIFHPTN